MTSRLDYDAYQEEMRTFRLTSQCRRLGTMKPDTAGTPHTTSLDALQSKEQLSLLDEIDKLRAYGVSDFVALPQLVVCGDQSAGKSSVLEAITEIPFPRNDNLCTRFATEIILRRGSEESVKVTIKPDQNRDESEQAELREFNHNLDDFTELPSIIELATKKMQSVGSDSLDSTEAAAFFMDVLSVEVAGPNKPQLSLVDLPGLIHSENKQQTKADVELVKALVESYLKQQRTIILAVISSTNDYACQIILDEAKKHDKEGKRTMGIITKPDLLPAGSDSERNFIDLALNKDSKINFKHGWHVLKNRGFEDRFATFEERNKLEATFFNKGNWKDLPRTSVGIHTLRSKLSAILHRHIKNELPSVRSDILKGIKAAKEELEALGERRGTIDEQRVFLSTLSQEFQRMTKAAVNGQYFAQRSTNEDGSGLDKRLKAKVRTKNEQFVESMRMDGPLRQITDVDVVDNILLEEDEEHDDDDISACQPEAQIKTTMLEALKWVRGLIKRSRGDELPGMFNPLLIANLYWEQSSPWEDIANRHVEDIWSLCYNFVSETLNTTTNKEVFDNLMKHLIGPVMDKRLEAAQNELKKLLEDEKRNPITYNHYFSDTFQKFRNKRATAMYEKKLAQLAQDQVGPNEVARQIDIKLVIQGLADGVEKDQQKFACTELLYAMLSYYKASLTPTP